MPYDRSFDAGLTREPRAYGPVHPGEVLQSEYLEPLGWSRSLLARRLAVPPRRVNEIVLGKRTLTADTALRLSLRFGTTPEFWLGLQSQYDLETVCDRVGERLQKEIRPLTNDHG